jgi:hypothetical protein
MKSITNNINLRSIIAGASSVDDALDRLEQDGGLSRGRAIWELRRINGGAYNEWMKAKWRSGSESPQRSGGFMQHFRFIGA